MSFVLDNSVSSRWFFDDGSKSDINYAEKVLVALSQQTAVVPVTWVLEAANVLARAEVSGWMTKERLEKSLTLIRGLTIEVDEETYSRSLTETLDLARRYKISACDASYLEIALRLDLPLATLDEKLIKAARKAGVERLT